MCIRDSSPDARDWISYTNDPEITHDKLSSQWEKEKAETWFKDMGEDERTEVTRLYNERVETLAKEENKDNGNKTKE